MSNQPNFGKRKSMQGPQYPTDSVMEKWILRRFMTTKADDPFNSAFDLLLTRTARATTRNVRPLRKRRET